MTDKKLEKIASWFDEQDRALGLLKQRASYFGKTVIGIQDADGPMQTIDLFYARHKAAYNRRVKNGTPHSVSILETELLNCRNKSYLTRGSKRVEPLPNLSQLDEDDLLQLDCDWS